MTTLMGMPCPHESMHIYMMQCNICGWRREHRAETLDEEAERLAKWARNEHPEWFL